MPAGATALIIVAPAGSPAGASFNEQTSDASGMKFVNDGETYLYVRNATVSAVPLSFFSDKYGAELEILEVSIPGSATEHGVKILGPFDPVFFNDHATTESASTGSVICTHTGSDGDLQVCPIKLPRRIG